MKTFLIVVAAVVVGSLISSALNTIFLTFLFDLLTGGG